MEKRKPVKANPMANIMNRFNQTFIDVLERNVGNTLTAELAQGIFTVAKQALEKSLSENSTHE